MALVAGDAELGTGLAGVMAAKQREIYPDFNLKEAAKYINVLAAAIVEYLVANAAVAVTELPGGTPIAPPGVGAIS